MSSKSKKQYKKSPRQQHQQGSAQADPVVEPEEHHALEIPDEVLHAPKETNKLRFALMIGLVIVLLIIFVVPQALTSIADRGRPDGTEISWNRPGYGRQEISASEYIQEKRAFEAALAVDALLGFQFGLPQGTIEREQVARLIILDQLALDAGVRVDVNDLVEHLTMLLNFPPYNRSAEAYKRVAANYGGAPFIEATIRRCMRGQRYLTLAGFAGGVAGPAAIEKAWNNDHVEVSFDSIELAVADLDEAARAELPDDEALEAWFDEEPVDVRGKLELPERRAMQFVSYVDPETTPAAELQAAFPEPTDADAEERANDYYNRVFHLRFVKVAEDDPEDTEEGEEGAEEGDEPEAGQADLQEFIPFDDVREQCLAEAPVYYAMIAWLTDLTTRQNAGEEVDFSTEAGNYGLRLTELTEAVTREELEDSAELGAASLVNEAFFTPPEAFGYSVLTTEKGLFVLRVTERVEPTLPEFTEIRDDVADLWVEPRREELATEKLQAIWDACEEFEPEEDDSPFPVPDDGRTHRRATAEAFRTAAEEAGLTVSTRDFEDKSEASFGDDYYRFFSLDVDEVAEPGLMSAGESVVLVRVSENREVPIERMSPREYDNYKTRARAEVSSSVATAFDLAYLESDYEFWLRPIEPAPEDDLFEDEAGEDEAGEEETGADSAE